MNLADGVFGPGWLWFGNGACLVLVAVAVRTGPWRLLTTADRQHVFAGASVACMLLWTISASVGSPYSFHLLGTTVLALMFGPALAFLGSVLALLGISLAGLAAWQAFGLNAVLMGALPIAVSYGVYRLADARLPNHFFVYVLVSAFVNGAAAMAASRLGTLALFWLGGVAIGTGSVSDYLLSTVLLAWAEALLTGMLMTLLIVYRPGWVRLFDDARYIVGR